MHNASLPPKPEIDMEALQQLTEAELAELSSLVADTPIWCPQPGPQQEAFDSKADILLYGGAAGGGKTSLAIGLALTQHHRTLFVRREGVQNTAAKDEMATLLGDRTRLNQTSGVFRLDYLRPGHLCHFVGVKDADDVNKYQGQPRDLLILDEAANLLESQARFLMGWVRPSFGAPPGQRCRTLMCSNPPTSPEGAWLIKFFAPWLDESYVSPNGLPRPKPGELRWFTSFDGVDIELTSHHPRILDDPSDLGTMRLATDEEIAEARRPSSRIEVLTPLSRTFIPSRIDDNMFLQGTSYKSTLQALPEPLRSQMLRGDFLAGLEDDVWQVIPSSWVQMAIDRWDEEGKYEAPMDMLGVDVSRGGRDESVVAKRHGHWFDKLEVFPGQSVPDGPALVSQIVRVRRNGAPITVDAIGVGSSVVDFLKEQQLPYIPFTGNEKSTKRDATKTFSFRNLRSEVIWRFRELLDPQNENQVALPPDTQMKADLCSFQFTVRDGNILQVESKKDIIKRLKRSPDRGEAIIYASMKTDARMLRKLERSGRKSAIRRSGGKVVPFRKVKKA